MKMIKITRRHAHAKRTFPTAEGEDVADAAAIFAETAPPPLDGLPPPLPLLPIDVSVDVGGPGPAYVTSSSSHLQEMITTTHTQRPAQRPRTVFMYTKAGGRLHVCTVQHRTRAVCLHRPQHSCSHTASIRLKNDQSWHRPY